MKSYIKQRLKHCLGVWLIVAFFAMAWQQAAAQCVAGVTPPTLSTYRAGNTCPVLTADLTIITASNQPANTTLTWHTGTPATTANKVTGTAITTSGYYKAAFFDAINNCYSPTSTNVDVGIISCNTVDTDNDGVPDVTDLDDDNDGILDTVECSIVCNDPFLNGGFENTTPLLLPNSYRILNAANVPGWQTTENVNGFPEIEIWSGGFQGVTAAEGNQFAELNAYTNGTLYQTFCLNGASGTVNWFVKHRGRLGVDVASVKFGTTLAQALSAAPALTLTDGNTAWGTYSGTYIIPAGQQSLVIGFQAVSTATGNVSIGNFLDGVQVTINQGCADTDGDGIPNSLDLDSDNDGCSDANEYYNNATADGGDGGIYGAGTPARNANGTVIAASYTGTYINAITATTNTISSQPVNQSFSTGADVTFTTAVSANAGATSYQWQESTNGGATWMNINNGGVYTGTTTATLTLKAPPASYTGYQYRAVLRMANYACGAVTNPATLTLVSSISGVLWNDINGDAVRNAGEALTNAGGTYANLINQSTGLVVGSVLVNVVTGAYSFNAAFGTNYQIVLTATQMATGAGLSSSNLPNTSSGAPWSNQGTNLSGTASTINRTGIISVTTPASGNLTNQNFGIQLPPVAVSSTMGSQANNGFSVAVPATQFIGSDADGGTVQSIRITAFPTNAISITINGVSYTASEFNTAFPTGVTISSNTSGNPLQNIAVKPALGNFASIVIPYVTIDNAGAVSAPSSVTIPFSTILPVTGLQLIVSAGAGCTNQLSWQTLTEANTKSFVVQYSTNGTNWKVLATLTAAGNSNTLRSYTYVNNVPTKGSNYYRINTIDKDGTLTYSNTVQATSNCNGKGVITAYPNPVDKLLTAKGVQAGSTLLIVNAAGKTILTQKATGSNTDLVNTSQLISGLYLLKAVAADGSTTTLKVVKR